MDVTKYAQLKNTLADLGFLEGVTLGTRASEASELEGVSAYGRMKFERL